MSQNIALKRESNALLLQELSTSFFVQSLAEIQAALNKDNSSIPRKGTVTEQSLAATARSIIEFYEKHCGRGTANSRPLIKLPGAIYQDVSINGSLHLLFKEVITAADKEGVTSPDSFFVKAPIETCISVLRTTERILVDAGLLKRPTVFFNKVSATLIPQLSAAVMQCGGQVTTEESSATHIIDWNEEVDTLPGTLPEDFIRILELKSTPDGDFALVHWWYHPDTYNEWISSSDVGTGEPPDLSSFSSFRTQWRVCCRFISDCAFYGEWGNEMDYENEAVDPDNLGISESGRKSRGKRKASLTTIAKTKAENPIPESILISEKIMQDLPPPSLLQKASQESVIQITGSIPNISNSEVNISIVNEESESEGFGLKRKIDHLDNVPVRNSPSWFSADSISDRERASLGTSCFKTSTDEALYLSIRNRLVNLYEQNMSQYLSATECRRKIVGGVGLIMKVHDFLDSCGIINGSVKQESRPLKQAVLCFFPCVSSNKFEKETASERCTTKADTPAAPWDIQLDTHLLEYVSTHNGDFKEITSAMTELKEGFAPSIEDCVARVLEIAIDAAGGKKDKKNDRLKSLSKVALNAIAEVRKPRETIDDLETDCSTTIELREYLNSRVGVLERKLDLLSSVEKVLDSDRLRIATEKRDVQMQRSQLSFYQSVHAEHS